MTCPPRMFPVLELGYGYSERGRHTGSSGIISKLEIGITNVTRYYEVVALGVASLIGNFDNVYTFKLSEETT